MRKVLLSTLAVMTLSGAAFADAMTLYTDPTTGQVYTASGEGRVEMGDFVSAKEVYLQNQEQDSVLAKKESKKKETPVFAKASKLKFSGLHYLGYRYRSFAEEYTQKDPTISTRNASQFETRRNYLQVKAYFFDDPKSYMRMTLDTFQENDAVDTDGTGSWMVRLKYAYLYLNEVLPYTGVEFGQVHRPWIDYEEHNSFFYRSVSKVFVESKNASDLTNSADLGFNLKTKLPYFSSEVGVFNGEGYHAIEEGSNVSLEWRATAHIMGTGKTQKDKPTTATYWDASFFGQYNMGNDKYNGTTYKFYGLHSVFNMPAFMLGAQYVKSGLDYEYGTTGVDTDPWYKKNGQGFSVHAVGRFGDEKQFELFGRYDNWVTENANDQVVADDITTNNYIYGAAWQQNKNVKWLVNGITYNPVDDLNYKGSAADQYTDVMVTAEVHW